VYGQRLESLSWYLVVVIVQVYLSTIRLKEVLVKEGAFRCVASAMKPLVFIASSSLSLERDDGSKLKRSAFSVKNCDSISGSTS
jgi:hypothetical protein